MQPRLRLVTLGVADLGGPARWYTNRGENDLRPTVAADTVIAGTTR
jgi:hypothetical protein